MSITCKLIYKGKVWEYIYLNPNGTLNEEDREILIWNMIDMHTRGKGKRDVKGENYKAEIKRGKYATLESFAGQSFDIILETNKGKSKMSTLLIDRVNPSLN